MEHKPSKVTMNPKRLAKGSVRITDLNTGKSKDKPKRSLRDRAKRAAPKGSMADRIVNRDKVIDQATGRTPDVRVPIN